MTDNIYIRWEQRFANYRKALKKLSEAIDYIKKSLDKTKQDIKQNNAETVLDEIIKEGLIQRFEYTYEMAWNVMKDYATFQGNADIGGSRDAIRYAFASNLIQNGESWMDMIKSRIKTSHTYNEETANEIYTKIIDDYYSEFMLFKEVMQKKISAQQQNLFDKE